MIRNSLSSWLVGAFVAVASLQANAAGLGSLKVESVLGEPLRAQISVSATPAEVPSLKARLASPSAYEAAGLVYSGIVTQLVVTLKKDGGEPLLMVTSSTPINEPVVDLLVELTWSSGRVTREFTAFIDPPFIAAEREKSQAEEAMAEAQYEPEEGGAETQAANLPDAPTPQPLPSEGEASATTETEQPAAEVTAQAEMSTEPLPIETIGGSEPTLFDAEPEVTPPTTTVSAAGPAPAAGKKIGVIRGDTLSKIALANKPAGVTLEQMLVVLFRNNPTAFSGKNMNRLRTGKIIRLADADEYRSVTQGQALKEVRVQYSDWNAYRERVAAAAAPQMGGEEQPAQQAAAGTVTPKVEDRAPTPTEQSSEVVKLSKGEPAAGGKGAAGGVDSQALQEKLVASEKALQESNARVARLEKIIEDLQKLAEVKNEDLAQAQSQAAQSQAAAEPKPAPAPAPEPAKPEMTAGPKPDAEMAIDKPAVPAAPGTTDNKTTTQAPAPAAPATPAGSKANAPAPAPAVQKPPRRAPPPPPPSLVDRVMEQPVLLAAPIVVLLLIGWGVSKIRSRKREPKAGPDEVAPASPDAEAAPAKAFTSTDTDVGLASTRTGAGAEEVDPLEEAEIFLAYGRDAQAEELLKEALETHPARFDVHAKLLEIYARRSDKDAFENLAKVVQQGTGGSGEVWDRVVRLGYSIDPGNPRYSEGKPGDGEEFDASASQPENLTSTVDRLDFEVGGEGGSESSMAPDFDPSAASDYESSPVVDPEATMEGSLDDAATMKFDMAEAGLTATDLDLNSELPVLDDDETSGSAHGDDDKGMDFDMSSMPTLPEDEGEVTQDEGLEFNVEGLSTGSDEEVSEEEAENTSTDMPALDLSGISLDLDGSTTQTSTSGKDEKWYEVQTKFDLAKAYQEMGDNDGAKEILQEVITEGDSEQKAAAESVLASLG
ncbi:MAG: FimV/HubP family polar landmark protein [Burkholderiales bacterium]